MAGTSNAANPPPPPSMLDESASSIVYEPLLTFQDKENSVNQRHSFAIPTRGPLSTRHGSDMDSPGRFHRHQGWVDGMVKVANACNLLVLKNCNLCHVYANRQVEFEQREETGNVAPSASTYAFASLYGVDLTASSPAERVWHKLNASLEVDMYRQFLFDEESVGLERCEGAATTTASTTTTTTTPAVPHHQEQNAMDMKTLESSEPVEKPVLLTATMTSSEKVL